MQEAKQWNSIETKLIASLEFDDVSNQRVSSFDDETILALFGAQAAEDEDPRKLKSYFVKNKAFERVTADIPLRLVVGHKGIGKSAILVMAYQTDISNEVLALWLKPTDIAKAWSVDGPFVERVEKIKNNILSIIAEKSFDALNIYGKSAGEIPVVKSVRSVLRVLTKGIEEADGTTIEAKIAQNFQSSKKIHVYVDDIDRGWSATKQDIDNISALINAARDISNEDKNIHFRIGLRSDAYNLVRENDESGDKFEPYKIPVSWSNHDILVIIARRIANYFSVDISAEDLERQNQIEISKQLHPVITDRFQGAGHWSNRPIQNVLLSLTRRRPRDLVKLLSGAAFVAEKNNHNRIETIDLESSFPDYSKGRIADLVSEFRSELPEIERVLYSMKPTKKEANEKEKRFLYTNDELISKLNRIASTQNIFFKNGRKATGQSLAEFLFKIDFVIARRDEKNGIVRYYYEDHAKLQSNFVDFGFAWEVHPAYRWALNPTRVADLLKGLEP